MSSIFFRSKIRQRRLKIISTLAALAIALAAGLVFAVGAWLDYSQDPAAADLIVVLGGGYSRPFYAADLYRQGYAKEIWLCRPRPDPSVKLVTGLGIAMLSEEEIGRQILLRRGVPAAHIHIYGQNVKSTVDEAIIFKRAVDVRGKRILVVTARQHARRAGIIFRSVLREAAPITVVATPYESFSRPWWKDQDMARWAVLELSKTAYYMVGGRFLSQ